ncbi:MAG: hypothetical protein SPK80_03395 [Bacteroidales bacterium]|nr:hypothetical protein [Bacteroidales bacterium]
MAPGPGAEEGPAIVKQDGGGMTVIQIGCTGGDHHLAGGLSGNVHPRQIGLVLGE